MIRHGEANALGRWCVMSDPTKTWLANVEWTPKEPSDEDVSSGMPYATHSGIWNEPFFGMKMRCYRLNDGRAIFHADDFNTFMKHFLVEEG